MSDEQPSPESRRRRKRRLIWAGGVVVVILALVLTPPLINANRLAHRIATSMSQSLGRPVHLDNVTLNVLPFPGLTLENLVVSEDPSFGAEPVIRANKVTARLRFSSLWRRQVEFSTISFEVDEHGSGPSVNLVRRADGRWNIESILLHAAQQNAAPTEQAKASAAPRFPYIEATGARLNVKLGDEKQPLSLTEADFALWLPSPQQWRVRLTGKPARTDTSVSDTGVLTVEGSLERSARLADVPVEMSASWRSAPLGEASRLLTGIDAGWRGNVEVTAVLRGALGDATLNSSVKLTDVRRADYIPARTLQVVAECRTRIAVMTALLREASCTLPVEGVSKNDHGVVAATADTLNLAGLETSGLKIGMSNVVDARVLDWARLFSQRVPPDWSPSGTASGSVARVGSPSAWQGEIHDEFELTDFSHAEKPKDAVVSKRSLSVSPQGDKLLLAPVNIASVGKPALLLSGAIGKEGYTLRLFGSAAVPELKELRAMLPPLGDGLEQALPGWNGDPAAPLRVDVSCARNWGAAQTCIAARVVEPAKKPKRR